MSGLGSWFAVGSKERAEPALRRGARRSPVLGASALLAVAALLAALPATGEQPKFPECTHKPSDADIEGAKGAHKAAAQFFDRGDYDRAIQYWMDSYNFDCTRPALLLNIANAYEKKGDREAAVMTLEAYLVRAPNAPDAKTLSEKVANLRAQMRPTPATSGSAATPVPPPSASATGSGAQPPPPKTDDGDTNLVPWIIVGVGGVVMIGGGILVPVGLGAVSDAEAACPDRKSCEDQAVVDQGNNGRTQATLGGVALGVGAAAVAGGLVWALVFDDHDAKSGRVHVTPIASPGEAGVTARVTF
jgi:tetratricopeptide (TPR) repeat protein